MQGRATLLALALAIAVSSSAEAADSAGWQIHAAEGGRPLSLTYAAGEPVSYRFDCSSDAVIVTETGVTRLLDLSTGKPVGDDAQAAMPDGAAMMALFRGKGDPQFVPARAVM